MARSVILDITFRSGGMSVRCTVRYSTVVRSRASKFLLTRPEAMAYALATKHGLQDTILHVLYQLLAAALLGISSGALGPALFIRHSSEHFSGHLTPPAARTDLSTGLAAVNKITSQAMYCTVSTHQSANISAKQTNKKKSSCHENPSCHGARPSPQVSSRCWANSR